MTDARLLVSAPTSKSLKVIMPMLTHRKAKQFLLELESEGEPMPQKLHGQLKMENRSTSEQKLVATANVRFYLRRTLY